MKLKRDKYDAVFSDYIRWRDNWSCRRCHSVFTQPTKGLHCAHIYSRGNKGIRLDPGNALALCNGCHRYFTKRTLEFHDWCVKELGQQHMDFLKAKYYAPNKLTMNDKEILRLDYLARIETYKKRVESLSRPDPKS